jgi:hypothetical protein
MFKRLHFESHVQCLSLSNLPVSSSSRLPLKQGKNCFLPKPKRIPQKESTNDGNQSIVEDPFLSLLAAFICLVDCGPCCDGNIPVRCRKRYSQGREPSSTAAQCQRWLPNQSQRHRPDSFHPAIRILRSSCVGPAKHHSTRSVHLVGSELHLARAVPDGNSLQRFEFVHPHVPELGR